jgi:hypothetical protein
MKKSTCINREEITRIVRKIGRFLERERLTYGESTLGCLAATSRIMDANKLHELTTYQNYYNKLTDFRISMFQEGNFIISSFIKALCEVAIDVVLMDTTINTTDARKTS